MLALQIQQRDTKENLEAMRKGGTLPAVFYGRKEESTSVGVPMTDFLRVWKEAGESSIISLEGIGEAKEALIHDVALDPVTSVPVHADFYVIEKGKKLHVNVPLEFTGTAPAVKSLGGTLVKVLHELEIEALPRDLPHEITVDISSLKDFESHITVGDLALPEGVVALEEKTETVAMVAEPKEEEEEETPTDIDMDAIEVESKGKGEDSTEEGSTEDSADGDT